MHGVQGGAFEKLIARHPKTEAVVKRTVKPQPADLAVVFLGGGERQRVLLPGGIADESMARLIFSRAALSGRWWLRRATTSFSDQKVMMASG